MLWCGSVGIRCSGSYAVVWVYRHQVFWKLCCDVGLYASGVLEAGELGSVSVFVSAVLCCDVGL